MREAILRAVEQRPQTLEELSETLGIPTSQLRSALTGEFYHQSEIDHPQFGRMTVWGVKFSRLRVDADGRYSVAL